MSNLITAQYDSAGNQVWDPGNRGSRSGYPTRSPFSSIIKFDGDYIMSDAAVSGALAFTADMTGAIPGARTWVCLAADAVNVPNLAAFYQRAGSASYVNTSNQANFIFFEYDGSRVWCTISTAIGGLVLSPADLTSPSLSSATIETGAPNKIILTYNETLGAGITGTPTPGGTANTFSSHAVVGSTVEITVGTSYTPGQPVTISIPAGYVKDVAGNPCSALVGQVVTNNVGASAVAVVLSSQSANLLGPVAEVYTGSGGASYAGIGQLVGVLAGDGWVEMQKPNLTDSSSLVTFDVTSGLNLYSTGDYQASFGTNGVVGQGQNLSTLVAPDTPYTFTGGALQRMRMRRVGSVITVDITEDDGANWVVKHTFSGGTPTGTKYVRIYTVDARKIYQPRQTGVA